MFHGAFGWEQRWLPGTQIRNMRSAFQSQPPAQNIPYPRRGNSVSTVRLKQKFCGSLKLGEPLCHRQADEECVHSNEEDGASCKDNNDTAKSVVAAALGWKLAGKGGFCQRRLIFRCSLQARLTLADSWILTLQSFPGLDCHPV